SAENGRLAYKSIRRGFVLLVPGGFADLPQRLALLLAVEALDVEMAVEMVTLVLQHLGHEALALDHDRAAVEIDPLDASPWVPSPGEAEPGHRKAPLVDLGRLAPHLGQHWIEDVADLAVDEPAECAQRDADLI